MVAMPNLINKKLNIWFNFDSAVISIGASLLYSNFILEKKIQV